MECFWHRGYGATWLRDLAAAMGLTAPNIYALLAGLSSYADAHRARMGVNYKQIPVREPQRLSGHVLAILILSNHP
jgi:hypothetical protein